MRSLLFAAVLGLAGCRGDNPTFFGSDGGVLDTGAPWESGIGPSPGRPGCPGQESTINGAVLAPNQTDPVAGATVFIPSEVPELFPPTVQCEVCGSLGGAEKWWVTTSAFNGRFSLTGVCPGHRPLILQNGRFRRLVYVDVPAGGTVELTAAQTRLPRKNQESNLTDAVPRIAVATGDYDKMECVLRKIGLDDSAIDLYEDSTMKISPSKLPTFGALVNDVNKMKTYNIIFINCTDAAYEDELTKSSVRQNITDYIQSGGRFYVTDWSYAWIEQVEAFSPEIDFEPGPWGSTPEKKDAAKIGKDGLTVQAALKDAQLQQWLSLFPGAVTNGTALIQHFLGGWVMMHAPGTDVKVWVEGQVSSDPASGVNVNGVRPLTVTFNFKNCGKILFTSYHTEGREDEGYVPQAFPAYCGTGTSSPQDHILEYLIYDIANCVKPIG